MAGAEWFSRREGTGGGGGSSCSKHHCRAALAQTTSQILLREWACCLNHSLLFGLFFQWTKGPYHEKCSRLLSPYLLWITKRAAEMTLSSSCWTSQLPPEGRQSGQSHTGKEAGHLEGATFFSGACYCGVSWLTFQNEWDSNSNYDHNCFSNWKTSHLHVMLHCIPDTAASCWTLTQGRACTKYPVQGLLTLTTWKLSESH